jgi:hypothetical protein
MCPDATAIQVGVAARLGYDPFDEKAGKDLRVTIRQAAHGLEARIEMDDLDGKLIAERRLVSRRNDCKELASSVELAISIAIDPPGRSPEARGAVGAPPQRETSDAAMPLLPVESTRAQGPRSRTGNVAAGVVGGIRSAPSTSLGISLGAGLRGEVLSLGIEARADLPSSMALRVGSVSTSLFTGSWVPCLHSNNLAVCALATAGVLHASGDGLVAAKAANFFYGAVGARVALTYPVTPRWSLALRGDAILPLTETTLTVDGSPAWSSSTLAFALGLGAVAKIP